MLVQDSWRKSRIEKEDLIEKLYYEIQKSSNCLLMIAEMSKVPCYDHFCRNQLKIPSSVRDNLKVPNNVDVSAS